jgi:hypothetical protein
VAVVGDDPEEAAEGIEGEAPDPLLPGESADLLEMEGEVHGVEAQVLELRAEVALVACIEVRVWIVVLDVVADDHAVFQVVQEEPQGLWLLEPRAAVRPGLTPWTVTALVLCATFKSAAKLSWRRISTA